MLLLYILEENDLWDDEQQDPPVLQIQVQYISLLSCFLSGFYYSTYFCVIHV